VERWLFFRCKNSQRPRSPCGDRPSRDGDGAPQPEPADRVEDGVRGGGSRSTATMRALTSSPMRGNFYWALGMSYLLRNDADRAIEFLTRARAGNPHGFYVHMSLAGALRLQRQPRKRKGRLGESAHAQTGDQFAGAAAPIRLDEQPLLLGAARKTADIGLRRAGFPKERPPHTIKSAAGAFRSRPGGRRGGQLRRAAVRGSRGWRRSDSR